MISVRRMTQCSCLLPIFLLALYEVWCPEHQSSSALVPPKVSCNVLPEDESTKQTDIVKVSNLRAIRMKIVIKGSLLPPTDQIDILTDNPTATKTDAFVLVDVRNTGKENQTSVPIKIELYGSGQHLDERYFILLLEIPIEESLRKEQEMRYIEELASQSKQNSASSDPRIPQIYDKQKKVLADSLDRIFLENKVGIFAIGCKYVANGPNIWNGEVRSQLRTVEVVFNGHFFDQSTFRSESK